MEYSQNIGLGFINYYNSHKELILNENFKRLDRYAFGSCLISRTKEPHDTSTSSLYDLYIVPSSAANPEWSKNIGNIAMLDNEGWRFFTPYNGMLFWVLDEEILTVYSKDKWINLLFTKNNLQTIQYYLGIRIPE